MLNVSLCERSNCALVTSYAESLVGVSKQCYYSIREPDFQTLKAWRLSQALELIQANVVVKETRISLGNSPESIAIPSDNHEIAMPLTTGGYVSCASHDFMLVWLFG